MKLLDRQLEYRRWIVDRWADPDLVREAQRYGLRFDELFVVRPSDAQLPAAPKQWVTDHARSFQFDASGSWAACRGRTTDLGPGDVGVLLAALIGFAETVDGSSVAYPPAR